MANLIELLGSDKPITVILSTVWVVVIIYVLTKLPKAFHACYQLAQEVTHALERQTNMTDTHAEALSRAVQIGEDLEGHLSEQVKETQALGHAIRELSEKRTKDTNAQMQINQEQMRLLERLYFKMTNEVYKEVQDAKDGKLPK